VAVGAVQAAAVGAVQAGWVVQRPPGREAIASAPTVATVKRTLWASPATIRRAQSVAHR
jgi:hypothetical protein